MLDTYRTEVPVERDILDLIPFFIKSRESDLKKLKELFINKQFDEMSKISHTIKGIARPYGFPSLELFARELEGACKKSDASTALRELAQIESYLKSYSEDL